MAHDAVTQRDPSGFPSKLRRLAQAARRRWKIILTAMIVIAALAWCLVPSSAPVDPSLPSSFSSFLKEVEDGNVKTVAISPGPFSEDIFRYTLRSGEMYRAAGLKLNAEQLDLLRDKGIVFVYVRMPQDFNGRESSVAPALIGLLSTVLFVGAMVLLSQPDLLSPVGKLSQSATRFSDVAGAEEAKSALQEVVSYLKDPAKYERLGARFPRGIILHGDPGNGKTMLARAVAGEAGVPFLAVDASEFQSQYIAVASMKMRRAFKRARKMAPCIMFIDEIDAIGGARLSESSATAREQSSVLTTLLGQLDGFVPRDGLIVIAATNRLESLDSALVRSGRFDRHIHVPMPIVSERRAILAVHFRGLVASADIDLDSIAAATIGMSGADLANLANRAALCAASEGAMAITTEHASAAIQLMRLGEKRSAAQQASSPADRRVVAYHEAGHAVAALALGTGQVFGVSTVPRGKARGVTVLLPANEGDLQRRVDLEKRIVVLLSGRVAETLALGSETTGAQHDIQVATDIARSMVLSYGWGPHGLYAVGDTSGPNTKDAADASVIALLGEMTERSFQLLTHQRAALEVMAVELLANEEIGPERVAELWRLHKNPTVSDEVSRSDVPGA